MELSDQNGMMTPLDESMTVVLSGLVKLVESQRNICLSLVLLKPVVTIRSLEPHQMTREPLTPGCDSAV